MATTVQNVIDKMNIHMGDSGTDSISSVNRIEAINIATEWLINSFGFDMSDLTYDLSFFDTVYYYNITTDVPRFAEPVDLRVKDPLRHVAPFTRKTPRDFALEITEATGEDMFTIERRDSTTRLGVIHNSRFSAIVLHDCDSLTANGTWAVDASGSDATNLTLDSNEFQAGNASLNFDIDVSQSVNNLATIDNSTMAAVNLTNDEDLSSYVARVYIPDVTNFTSVTVYWGSDSTNYWSGTATTDILGNAFVAGWNRISVAWSATTKTSSPDVAAIDYLRLDFNYAGGQGDDTDFRVDDIRMIRPVTLELSYESWRVGESSGGTDLSQFTATADVPFWSGLYDFFDTPIAYKAASVIQLGTTGELTRGEKNEDLSNQELRKVKVKFPSSQLRQSKNFKVFGLKWK